MSSNKPTEYKGSALPAPYSPNVNGFGADNAGLQSQIDELRNLIEDRILNHTHDGGGAQRIGLDSDILGQFETVDTVPNGIPNDVYDQIKIYSNGSTYRFYWYDSTDQAWHYVTATA